MNSDFKVGFNGENEYHWFRRKGRGKVIMRNERDIARFVRRIRRIAPAATFDLYESAEPFREALGVG